MDNERAWDIKKLERDARNPNSRYYVAANEILTELEPKKARRTTVTLYTYPPNTRTH